MHARAFDLIGASSLSAFRARLEAQLEGWCSDWGLGNMGIEVSCARAWEAAQALRPSAVVHASTTLAQRWFESDAGCARVAWHAGLEKSLQHALFPGGPHPFSGGGEAVIANAAGEAALASLVESLARVLTGAVELAVGGEWAEACSRPASGALLVTVSGSIGPDPLRLSCLFDHAAVRALRVPPEFAYAAPARLSLTRALRNVGVRLPVMVGEAEVELANLTALAVGDVIRLDAPVDEPSTLQATDGASLLQVFLGRMGRDVAVEVVGWSKTTAQNSVAKS
jgi:hypothetical protein